MNALQITTPGKTTLGQCPEPTPNAGKVLPKIHKIGFSVAGLDVRQLALVEPLTVGFHAIARGRVEAQDSLTVFGCGVIGLGAIAGAAERGATVIAVDIDDRKLELARKLGAQHGVNSKT